MVLKAGLPGQNPQVGVLKTLGFMAGGTRGTSPLTAAVALE
jgi:hypothetical protein